MKIIIVGATGAVGATACNALASRHEIIRVGRTSGDIRADLEDRDSIRSMYQKIGMVDAVVCAAGTAFFGPTADMRCSDFFNGIQHKLAPQIRLVLEGFDYVNDHGSFTLTSGVSNREPIAGSASAAAANGALDGFVVGAAVDMPRGIRINAVSPGALEVSRDRHPERFHGHQHVSSEAVGLAYCKSVEGCSNGQIIVVK